MDPSGLLDYNFNFNSLALDNLRIPNLSLPVEMPSTLPSLASAVDGVMSAISRVAPMVSALGLTGDTPQYMPIYRAMNQVELGRTMKYGYQMGSGSFDSGKQFTMWPGDAYRLAQALPKLDLPEQSYNYRVVTSMASSQVVSKSQISQGQIDIGIINRLGFSALASFMC